MIIHRKAVWGALVLGALLMAGACDERLRDVTGPTPDLQPTFTSIQTLILQSSDSTGRRACVSCHTSDGRNPSAGLNLAVNPYEALVNVPSRERPALKLVAPGDPENSYVVHKLEGRGTIGGARMPQSGPPYLTDGQMLVIRRWIAIGAPKN